MAKKKGLEQNIFFYDKFKEYLKAQCLSVIKLSKLTGVNRSTLYRWLEGDCSPTLFQYTHLILKLIAIYPSHHITFEQFLDINAVRQIAVGGLPDELLKGNIENKNFAVAFDYKSKGFQVKQTHPTLEEADGPPEPDLEKIDEDILAEAEVEDIETEEVSDTWEEPDDGEDFGMQFTPANERNF